MVADIVGEEYNEGNYFEAQFVRYHAGYAGWPRVPVFISPNEHYASPGHALVPSIRLKIGQLTCGQYVELLGEILHKISTRN